MSGGRARGGGGTAKGVRVPRSGGPRGSVGGGRMDRKDFLRAAGAVCGAGWLAGCAREGAPARGESAAGGEGHGSQPLLDVVGLQLYTVRSLMAEDVAGTLDAVAAIGYQEVEFAGYFGHAPAEVRGWLDAAGLSSPAAHVGMAELEGAGLAAAFETASTLGQRWLVLPWIPEETRTADGYRALADMLNAAGETAAAANFRVAYHNHAFEFDAVDDDGATGFSLLLERLDPALVDLEIDFHWSAVGGADSAALLRDNPGRFPLCHVKDVTADGRMADVGAGVIDWAALFALSDTAGLRHFFVEHDQPGDPLASVEASYRYLSGT